MTNAVITTTGPDKPGVSAAFFRVLGSYNVELVDVEQALFSGRISLSAFVDVDPNRLEDIEQGLRNTLSIYQQQISAELSDALPRPRSTHAVVVMGRPVTASHLSSVAQELANFNVNIDRIRGLSQEPVTALDLSVTVPGEEEPLRKALAALSAQLGIDIAVESAGLSRRSRRLICFDCDSTLITGEVIEMLAAHAGKEAEVAAVTERAMRGELDFEHSLRERVATLAGLPARVIDETTATR